MPVSKTTRFIGNDAMLQAFTDFLVERGDSITVVGELSCGEGGP
jgi:hypothetical protein